MLVAACATRAPVEEPEVIEDDVGFLVAAPDRGFLGNEEIADAFAGLKATRNAALLTVTDERTGHDLHVALGALIERGAKRVVVLPLFLSAGEARFGVLERALADHGGMVSSITMGQRLGDSYFAAELLADRLRAIEEPAGRRVVIAGHGAADEAGAARLRGDLERIAAHASAGLGFESVQVVVWRARDAVEGGRDRAAEAAFGAAVLGGKCTVVVPFQLGPRMDSMMTFPAFLGQHLHGAAELADVDVTPDPMIALWMEREARRHVAVEAGEVGVVFLAHGADHHWNQGMREAAARLAAAYPTEFSFSMADPPLIERAVRRLEARGVRRIVVVRVFGLSASFRGTVERLFGIDVERGGPPVVDAGHGGHGGHGGHVHGPALPAPRIRSSSLITTVGGLEDSAHFAAALLDRASALSQDPGRETVVLVAHGDGDDARNAHWRHLLGSIADQMRAAGGSRFRAIEVGTWREDWPAQREPELRKIRAIVEAASANGGRAIVIPARTTGQGSEREFLDGLRYELGAGFAPHPRFDAWLDEQVARGIAQLGASATPASPAPAKPAPAVPAPAEHAGHTHHAHHAH